MRVAVLETVIGGEREAKSETLIVRDVDAALDSPPRSAEDRYDDGRHERTCLTGTDNDGIG
jgi:hypothetical protein